MNVEYFRPRWFLTAALVACVVIGFSSRAQAEEKNRDDWFGGWRYELDLGVFAADVETVIRLDATDTPGTEFSFESALGLDDNDTSPLGRFAYRFGRRSSISISHFELRRDGTSQSTIAITLPDPDDPDETIVIDQDVLVRSLFNATTTVVAYGYSFINNEKAEFGFRFGVHVTELELGLATPNQPDIPDTLEDITAPLPTFGIIGGYTFGEHWSLIGDLGYFALEIGSVDGSIASGVVGVLWQPFDHVGFGLNYRTFEVEVNATSSDFGGVGGSFNWRYKGPGLNVKVRF
jgi:hypothetical protein